MVLVDDGCCEVGELLMLLAGVLECFLDLLDCVLSVGDCAMSAGNVGCNSM